MSDARAKELLSRLPATYKKLTLHTLSKDFAAATRVDTVPTAGLVDTFVHGKGLLLLRVAFAGVNASDVMYSNGFYNPGKKTPYDTGMEGIGEVVAVSPDVTAYKPGDYVMCSMNAGGWFGEYRVVPARVVMRAGNDPRYLTLLISGLTTSFALEKTAGMRALDGSVLARYLPPELVEKPGVKPLNVIVTAAAGGAGLFAVQLAALGGHRVIGTCSSEEKAEFLRKIGCAVVVNYKTQDLRTEFKKALPNGADLVYESVGGDTFDACVENLAIGGKMLIIGAISGYLDPNAKGGSIASGDFSKIMFGKSGSVASFYLPHFTKEYPVHYARLVKMMEDGVLDCRVDLRPAGVEKAPEAVGYLHSGRNVGKVVLPLARL
ncbi:NADPH:quinone reductase [Hyaloraphidium curvatum]|nr:NADPH:quinone reductase [Hyaloraphidium curvatum]